MGVEDFEKVWTEVEYYSGGYRIAAFLYVPEDWKPGDPPRPAVVTLHGYSGMKEIYGLYVPDGLYRAGYAVLAIDNRGFNKSEGTRGRANPTEQVEDVYDAVSYLETLPSVDSERIGVYGTSWGGGLAIWSAAFDDRIKVCVSSAGVHDGERWMREARRHWEWPEFQERIRAAARRRVTDGESETVEFTEMMVTDPHTAEIAIAAFQQHPAYFSTWDIQSAEWCSRWRPIFVAERIAPRPVMIIYAEHDRLVPPQEQLDCFAACGEPKKLLKLPKAQHYESYQVGSPELAEFSLTETVAWYDEHL